MIIHDPVFKHLDHSDSLQPVVGMTRCDWLHVVLSGIDRYHIICMMHIEYRERERGDPNAARRHECKDAVQQISGVELTHSFVHRCDD